METQDILKKVRHIEIKTRGLSRQVFAGQYHSAFKGKGMTFSEVREYQYGDAIRDVDWNVTARFNHPYVKVFEEERELTVMLLIDISGSKDFGTDSVFKREFIAELAAVLSFSAIQNNDKIGVILFSSKVEKFIPPQKGRKHILRIISELLRFEPTEKGTNISNALEYFTGMIKKRSTAFLISDFIDRSFDNALMIANKKHDVAALRVFDPGERVMPPMGLVEFADPETGELKTIDTSSRKNRMLYEKWWKELEEYQRTTFRKSGVDAVNLSTDEDYVQPLVKFFKKRSM
ncbi:MAG TPA: DUF58 domain-containing protein [Salinivirga sp.]|uniref:DUF58 domain-containing protein n=1 Tax=Salinivirga sp. TaxID=1970192 RepID=UPI002B49A5E1|nr:DUF58 domain-containing protein [Salinivirga sp.]HKK59338.1 DUF58 domain-containing protein [Salinivirga sp.]